MVKNKKFVKAQKKSSYIDKWAETMTKHGISLKTKKRNPMRRTTTPNDIANTISLLLKQEADFINCSIIYCDGGEHRSGTF